VDWGGRGRRRWKEENEVKGKKLGEFKRWNEVGWG
jgi:hypothetical protein